MSGNGATSAAVAEKSDAEARAADLAAAWLAEFSRALSARDELPLRSLFVEDAWWRDILAFDWDLRSTAGGGPIVARLLARSGAAGMKELRVLPGSVPRFDITPRGRTAVAFFEFKTAKASCRGVLRLIEDPHGSGAWRAWLLTTEMNFLWGFEEKTGDRRPKGIVHGSQPGRKPFAVTRVEELDFRTAEPEVLIVGAGQAGLCLAARLGQLGAATLVVERHARVGDNWRLRYPSLTLHDPVYANHLPYLPFPETWPLFSPKDKLADWLESYARALDLNVWTGAQVASCHFEDGEGWTVTIETPTEIRTLHPQHLVLAIGLNGEPNIPRFRGMEEFRGTVVHSGRYGGGKPWHGKNAIVIGAGTSGHDMAQDLHEQGAHVTMVQRSSTLVVSSRQYVGALERLYGAGKRPLAEADLEGVSIPLGLMETFQRPLTARNAEADKPILDALLARGFKLDFGPCETGIIGKHLSGVDGYYIDVGASRLVADGEIGLKQGVEIERFDAGGVHFADRSYLPADLAVLATGYGDMREAARRIVGREVDRCQQDLYRLDSEGEQTGVWRPSGHPGLWFMVGSFQRTRYYSRILALQIKARLAGLTVPVVPSPPDEARCAG